MCNWKGSAVFLLVILGLAAVVVWTTPTRREVKANPGPQKILEVRAIGEKLGLHWHGDDRGDPPADHRVFLSEAPLHRERASALAYGRHLDIDWVGTVAVYYQVWMDIEPQVMDGMVVWGKFILYGDPKLIQRLVACTERKSE